jgi:hypothetical protein
MPAIVMTAVSMDARLFVNVCSQRMSVRREDNTWTVTPIAGNRARSTRVRSATVGSDLTANLLGR